MYILKNTFKQLTISRGRGTESTHHKRPLFGYFCCKWPLCLHWGAGRHFVSSTIPQIQCHLETLSVRNGLGEEGEGGDPPSHSNSGEYLKGIVSCTDSWVCLETARKPPRSWIGQSIFISYLSYFRQADQLPNIAHRVSTSNLFHHQDLSHVALTGLLALFLCSVQLG